MGCQGLLLLSARARVCATVGQGYASCLMTSKAIELHGLPQKEGLSVMWDGLRSSLSSGVLSGWLRVSKGRTTGARGGTTWNVGSMHESS